LSYKGDTQLSKEINNAIELDKKNGNLSWEKAIKTDLKKLIDYRKFIIVDSGECISTDYREMGFDVKYYLRHEARLVSSDNWTIIDIFDI
jgi:hypothetical protein